MSRPTGDVRPAAGGLGLVLGGGGVAGVAWHTGVLWGLAEAGVDVTAADRIVGTSAGATVGAQLVGGSPLRDLFDRQLDPAGLAEELRPPVTVAELWSRLAPIYAGAADDADRRRRLGALALGADTVAEPVRRQVISARLRGADWSGDRLSVVVVDAVTGERRVVDGRSGVGLVDAVTASCAVPGAWPPVTIGGVRYIDGGVWSLANVDLAAGCARVLVLAPIVDGALHREIAGLGDGVDVVLVTPDADSTAAFGGDVLDPAVRGPAAVAGRAQGRVEAGRVGGLLAG